MQYPMINLVVCDFTDLQLQARDDARRYILCQGFELCRPEALKPGHSNIG